MPVIIEFSRCIGTYSSAKFELTYYHHQIQFSSETCIPVSSNSLLALSMGLSPATAAPPPHSLCKPLCYYTNLKFDYFIKLFSFSKKAFSKIIYSSSEHTSLHFLLYSTERSNISLILIQGNSLHWLHLSTQCSFVHSTN